MTMARTVSSMCQRRFSPLLPSEKRLHAHKSMRDRLATGEDGSILLLTIFYGFLSLALILMVVAATSLYLERKRLFTLADAAAIVGAESFALEGVHTVNGNVRPSLNSGDVNAAVSEFLGENPHGYFENLGVVRAESLDGTSATVELSASWRPPVFSVVAPTGIRLQVTAVARSVFW
jgi:uncharacterized membrane protein